MIHVLLKKSSEFGFLVLGTHEPSCRFTEKPRYSSLWDAPTMYMECKGLHEGFGMCRALSAAACAICVGFAGTPVVWVPGIPALNMSRPDWPALGA